jgi:hypothetical protein
VGQLEQEAQSPVLSVEVVQLRALDAEEEAPVAELLDPIGAAFLCLGHQGTDALVFGPVGDAVEAAAPGVVDEAPEGVEGLEVFGRGSRIVGRHERIDIDGSVGFKHIHRSHAEAVAAHAGISFNVRRPQIPVRTAHHPVRGVR